MQAILKQILSALNFPSLQLRADVMLGQDVTLNAVSPRSTGQRRVSAQRCFAASRLSMTYLWKGEGEKWI
jgi:hypothetical protein